MTALPKLKPITTAEPDHQLTEAERMETIGRLVSGVAHDFNNLLTGVVLCSDLLLAGLEKDNRLRRYAEEIRTASDQGAAMIQHLLAIARQRTAEPSLLSLTEVIQSMRALLIRLIGENIGLMIDLATDLRLVLMDPAEAQEIILNLVLNARDALPDGGQICLVTRNRRSDSENHSSAWFVELVVRDNGTGMDAPTRARAFEPFFTTKTAGKGTGLGLATVRRFVTQRGGTVEIASEIGRGTEIAVRLPAQSKQGSKNSDGRKFS